LITARRKELFIARCPPEVYFFSIIALLAVTGNNPAWTID
jgi:hypothetical protein